MPLQFKRPAPAGHPNQGPVPAGSGHVPAISSPRGAPAARPAPAAQQSRWAGMGDGQQRTPQLEAGDYRLQLQSAEIRTKPAGKNRGRESYHVTVEVIESEGGDAVGAVRNMIFMPTDAGLNELFRCVRSAAGYESEADMYAAYPAETGAFKELLDAVFGLSNAYNGNPLAGRLFDCLVSRGKDVLNESGQPTGDWYRQYQFTVVPDAEQPAP